jgi:hypothetical protein
VHPERVILGAHPARGLVLAGTVTALRPAGAGWEVSLRVGGAGVVCRVADRPAIAGGQLVVTALAPPCFGPDGSAIRGEERGAAWPWQASA